MSDSQSAPQASAPAGSRPWPGWVTAVAAVGYWAALFAGATFASEFAPHALCWRRLGLFWSARCADPHGESMAGALWLEVLGIVAFFVGSSQFDGWFRVYYWALYLVLLLTWAAAVAFAPELPLALQVLVPLAVAAALKRHVDRVEASAAAAAARSGVAEA